ncbi:MAG: intradiol ring-cleavage dioxygenase [Thermodesulfobacteriota bacterium]
MRITNTRIMVTFALAFSLATTFYSAESFAGSDCHAPAEPTPAMIEGPYFKPDSPQRRSLWTPNMEGRKIIITGQVLSTNCRPVPNARLDFWQTDGDGRYDLDGYRLRGHQYTDEQGRYRLETVVPGSYGGRTRHIHVKVAPPGGPVLTTQLFFPGAQRNTTDRIFDPRLLLEIRETEKGLAGTFDFIMRSAE